MTKIDAFPIINVSGDEFDYVVCGAGAAGCALAARLSANPNVSVLLIEGGHGDTPDMVSTPLRTIEIWNSDYDWGYSTIPQKHCHNRQIYWPRGKVMGGSSSMNGMIYVRGHAMDYDMWAHLGNHGWDWASVLPYFKQVEDFDRGADAYHGVGGPMHVTTDYKAHPLMDALIDAAVQAGIPFNPDYNGASLDGISRIQFNISKGKRVSTAAGFLEPVRGRSNLKVAPATRVEKLIIEKGRVTGVHCVRGAERFDVGVRFEAVLSAGTLESPRILMLSGIGPKAHLAEFDIETKVDLAGVGQNLHDHTFLPMVFESRADYPFPDDPSLPPMQVHMFLKSHPDMAVADIQPLFFSVPAYAPGQSGPMNAFTLHAGGIRPTSRGELKLTGTDVNDPLHLDPNLLATDYDVKTLITSMRQIREIAAQPALKDWVKGEVYPGPKRNDDESLADYARSAVGSYHHQVGTCAMGVTAQSVVDPQLRVYGVKGLRVADASIMPFVPSGNTAAPSVMIGTKAGDMMAAAHN